MEVKGALRKLKQASLRRLSANQGAWPPDSPTSIDPSPGQETLISSTRTQQPQLGRRLRTPGGPAAPVNLDDWPVGPYQSGLKHEQATPSSVTSFSSGGTSSSTAKTKRPFLKRGTAESRRKVRTRPWFPNDDAKLSPQSNAASSPSSSPRSNSNGNLSISPSTSPVAYALAANRAAQPHGATAQLHRPRHAEREEEQEESDSGSEDHAAGVPRGPRPATRGATLAAARPLLSRFGLEDFAFGDKGDTEDEEEVVGEEVRHTRQARLASHGTGLSRSRW
eukprot:scaffold4850_cov340-Prasinococcus_capsulatus_cf.AAC.5